MEIIYVLKSDQGDYIKRQGQSQYTITSSFNYAEKFDSILKARNVVSSLPKKMLKRDQFFVVEIDEESKNILDIKDLFCILDKTLEEIIAKKSEYRNMLSKIDQEIEDIKHFGEFNRLSAYHGYKWYKLFHDKLNERREIKNHLDEISALESLRQKANSTEEKIEKPKKYKPRLLKDLFEEGI